MLIANGTTATMIV